MLTEVGNWEVFSLRLRLWFAVGSAVFNQVKCANTRRDYEIRLCQPASCLALFFASCAGAIYQRIHRPVQWHVENSCFRRTLIVADPQSQRIYISGENGAVHEVTFEEAISNAEPDPANRAALRESFWAGLTNPELAGAFAIPLRSVDYFHVPNNPCDYGSNPAGWEEECTIGAQGRAVMQSGDGEGALEKPVDLETVTVTALRPHVIENTGGAAFYSVSDVGNYDHVGVGGGYVDYQRYYTDNFNSWNKNRSSACTSAVIRGVSTVAAGVAAGVACLAIPAGGVTSVACAAGIVGTVALWAEYSMSVNTCMSNYPGPGNW